jgi:predicted DNA-binding protein
MNLAKKNTKAVCFRLPNKMQAALVNVAKHHETTTSEVIRYALKKVLDEEI